MFGFEGGKVPWVLWEEWIDVVEEGCHEGVQSCDCVAEGRDGGACI